MSNWTTFQSNPSVKLYAAQDQLQKPEETIFYTLKENLLDMKMLDIGVGGGRTTLHFAPLVKEYIGVDYANSMISACKDRFSNAQENISFKCCDVRSMIEFGDKYFDFILFSFNGIDYISHSDRIKALNEIKRIGKPNAFFVFSSHNSQSIRQFYKLKFKDNFLGSVKNIIKCALIFMLNGPSSKYIKSKHTIFNDGAFRFKLKTYYIKPSVQIEQLEELGFKNIKIYSLSSGREIEKTDLNLATDNWIYYLCQL